MQVILTSLFSSDIIFEIYGRSIVPTLLPILTINFESTQTLTFVHLLVSVVTKKLLLVTLLPKKLNGNSNLYFVRIIS